MPHRDPTSTPDRARTRYLLVLGPVVVANALIAALSRFLGRRKDPVAQVERAVREVREEMGRGTDPGRPQPTQKEVLRRREERRRREAEAQHR